MIGFRVCDEITRAKILSMYKRQEKVQPFPKNIAIVIEVISSDEEMKYVKVIPFNEFAKHELDPYEIDYCAFVNGNIFISSKAKYNRVQVHGLSKEICEQLDIINNRT